MLVALAGMSLVVSPLPTLWKGSATQNDPELSIQSTLQVEVSSKGYMSLFQIELTRPKLLVVTTCLLGFAACKAEKPPAPPVVSGVAVVVPPKVITTFKQVDRLPDTEELRIEGNGTIYIRSSGQGLDRIEPDGSMLLDRYAIDPATGKLAEDKKTRKATEITLVIGGACSWQGISDGHQYKYLRVNDSRVEIHHTGITRGGVPIDEILSSPPYER